MVKTGQMTPQRGALAIALLGVGLAMSALAASAPANAKKVGVAAAVNPDAFSSLSGVPNKQLNIGKSIFYNERIETTANGLVQVLLVDGSTFTVGPNSNLVIDKFVYDPNKKTGEVVATFSKGSMRFIGGKLSKNAGGVKVNTPSGALAIRGGMFQGNTQRKIYSFLYGHSMVLRGRNGKVHTVYQPGYTLDLSRGAGTVRPTTAEDTAVFAKALSRGGSSSSGNGGEGGSEGGQQQASANQAMQSVSVQNMISDATSEAIATEIDDQLAMLEKKDPPPPANDPRPTPTNTNAPPPPPPEIDARVIHIDGDGNLTDFNQTFQVIDQRLVADIPAIEKSELRDDYIGTRPSLRLNFPETLDCVDGFCSVTDAQVVVDGEPINYFGHAIVKPGFFGYHIVNDGLTEPEQEALLSRRGNPDASKLLVFGGKKYKFAPPTGKVFTFELANDPGEGLAPPFASRRSSAIGEVSASISPLFVKEQSAEGSPDSNVWLQTSFAVGTGEESEGQSFINIALGNWSPDEGLQGSRRGGADLDDNNFSFSGDVESLSGPNGDHFLGSDDALPNAVLRLEGDDTPLHEVVLPIRENGVLDSSALLNDGFDQALGGDKGGDPSMPEPEYPGGSGSTYHLAAGVETPEDFSSDATSGQFKGYAAGFAQRANGGAPNSAINLAANEVTLSLDSETNSVEASMRLHQFIPIDSDGDLLVAKTYDYSFGGQGNSALINDDVFAGIESVGASTLQETGFEFSHYETRSRFAGWKRVGFLRWEPVYEEYEFPIYESYEHNTTLETQSYIVSADAIGANEVLFPKTSPEDVQKRAFCQSCDFIKWGTWGTRTTYTDQSNTRVTEDTHLGWWITGDVVPEANIDKLAELEASAFYEGDAVGTVAKYKNGAWNQFMTTGDMSLDWNFGQREGDFAIKNFDNRNFGGKLVNLPGTSGFTGIIGNANLSNPSRSIVGGANGSFVGFQGINKTPKGVIGNFDVRQVNDKWRANGIYGGTQRIPR